jgi:hypothetical protein
MRKETLIKIISAILLALLFTAFGVMFIISRHI